MTKDDLTSEDIDLAMRTHVIGFAGSPSIELPHGQVKCERCYALYLLGDKHACKASEPPA